MMVGFFSSAPAYVPQDYTTNLWEEWVATEGMTIDANNLDIDSWNGYRNSKLLQATLTTEDKPVGGVLTLPLDGQGFNLPSNPGIAATDFTVCFLIEKTVAHGETNGIWMMDTFTAPRFVPKFEISSSNSNMGLLYNGVDLDFGAPYPFGSGYKNLSFVISGTTARVLVDGAQVGNTITGLTGGSVTMNSAATRRVLRGGSTTTRNFKGGVKKIRFYTEAVSDSNLLLISDHANSFYLPIQHNAIRLFDLCGQSLIAGNGSWSGLPSYLTGNIPRCYIWNRSGSNRFWEALSSTTHTLCSPILEFAYQMQEQYPNEDIYFVEGAAGGTSLGVNWLAPSGSQYVNNRTWMNNALANLSAGNRTIYNGHLGILWGQGESDAADLTMANAYQTNEAALFSALTTEFTGITSVTISSHRLHDLLPAITYVYRTTVNAAKDTNSGLVAGLINIDDQTTYPIGGDNIHPTQTGYIALGAAHAIYH